MSAFLRWLVFWYDMARAWRAMRVAFFRFWFWSKFRWVGLLVSVEGSSRAVA